MDWTLAVDFGTTPPTTRAPATRAPRTTAPSTTAAPTTHGCTHHRPATEEGAEPTYDPGSKGTAYGGSDDAGRYPADSNVDPWTGAPLNHYGGDTGGS